MFINLKGQKNEVLSSLCISIIICAQYISTVLGLFTNSEGGYFSIVIITALILLVISSLVHPLSMVTSNFFYLVYLVVFAFILTHFLVPSHTNLAIIDYIGMCLLPLICGGILKPNYKLILKINMFILCISIPVINELFTKANNGTAYDAIKMGTSYAILPVVSSGIIHFFFYRKQSSIIEKVLYVICCVYICAFIPMSYRGALIALLLVCFLGWYYSSLYKKDNKKRTIAVTLIVIVLIMFFLNTESILRFAYSVLQNKGIKIAFIDKYMFLLSENDISHGRIEIWKIAISGFFDSPIWGHGLATFLYYTGYVFPHNFILQFLFEGGIILTIPIMYFLLKGLLVTRKKYYYCEREKFTVILLLACTSLPHILVSAESWRVMLFWLMMGIMGNKSNAKENTEVATR